MPPWSDGTPIAPRTSSARCRSTSRGPSTPLRPPSSARRAPPRRHWWSSPRLQGERSRTSAGSLGLTQPGLRAPGRTPRPGRLGRPRQLARTTRAPTHAHRRGPRHPGSRPRGAARHDQERLVSADRRPGPPALGPARDAAGRADRRPRRRGAHLPALRTAVLPPMPGRSEARPPARLTQREDDHAEEDHGRRGEAPSHVLLVQHQRPEQRADDDAAFPRGAT